MTEAIERRPVPGFPGYEIDSDGTVHSLPRTVRHAFAWRPIAGRIKKPCTSPDGHLKIQLHRDGRTYTRSVNALWLAAFPEMGEGE